MARSRTDRQTPKLGLLGLLAVIGGSLIVGFLARRNAPRRGGHVPTDLALDKPHPGPDDRAPEAFRPDPHAPVPEEERDAFAPATIPSMVGRGI